MYNTRLILILSNTPDVPTKHHFQSLCHWLQEKSRTPIIIAGLHKDVTLTLSCKLPKILYNPYEFLGLDNPVTQELLNSSERYTINSNGITGPLGPTFPNGAGSTQPEALHC